MNAKKAEKEFAREAPAKKQTKQAATGKGKAGVNKDEVNSLTSGAKKPRNQETSDERSSTAPDEDSPGKQSGSDASGVLGNEENSRLNAKKPASFHHRRVVELATRLACAQITAEAYSKSARLTVSGIQRVAAAFVMASARIKMDLETLRSNPDLIDAAFVDRAYADLLKAAEVNELPLDQATPLNHPDHDDLFEGAMFRAQRLLKSPSEDTTLIHAEQLFDAEEILTENQVGRRFERCNWPVLCNRDDFYKFIVRVERWFHDQLGRLHFPEEDEQYEEDAEMMGYVLELGRRRQENDLFRQIYDLVRTHALPNRPREAWTSIEEMSHAMWTQWLIDVIFCGHRPSKSRKKKKDARNDKENRIFRRYRPWGLFRFLRIHGADDPTGSKLLESLVCERRDLALDAVVHPFRQNYPSTYNFGQLDRLVEERAKEHMQKSAIQSAVKLEAVSELLEAVQTVETLPKPITDKFQKDVLRSARSGKHFDPKWMETIRDGFKAILLTGTECPMDRMIGFLLTFYLPLLHAYGALDAVAKHRSDHYPHELIDLFPDGWNASLLKNDSEPSLPQDTPENQQEYGGAQAADTMRLTLRSGAGEERSVSFHRFTSVIQDAPDDA